MYIALWILCFCSFAFSPLYLQGEPVIIPPPVDTSPIVADRGRDHNRDNEKDTLYEENKRNIREEARQHAHHGCCEDSVYYYYPQ